MLKRFAAIALVVLSLTVQGCVGLTAGLNAYVDALDGYQFLYPNGWVQMKVSDGPDVVFRDLIEETENVSVVVSAVESGKKLQDLGSPSEVGLQLAKRVLAPPTSNREADLLAANEYAVGDKTYYNLEYLVKLPNGVERHNLANVAVSRGKLYTLNVSSPEQRWPVVEDLFKRVAASFTVD